MRICEEYYIEDNLSDLSSKTTSIMLKLLLSNEELSFDVYCYAYNKSLIKCLSNYNISKFKDTFDIDITLYIDEHIILFVNNGSLLITDIHNIIFYNLIITDDIKCYISSDGQTYLSTTLNDCIVIDKNELFIYCNPTIEQQYVICKFLNYYYYRKTILVHLYDNNESIVLKYYYPKFKLVIKDIMSWYNNKSINVKLQENILYIDNEYNITEYGVSSIQAYPVCRLSLYEMFIQRINEMNTDKTFGDKFEYLADIILNQWESIDIDLIDYLCDYNTNLVVKYKKTNNHNRLFIIDDYNKHLDNNEQLTSEWHNIKISYFYDSDEHKKASVNRKTDKRLSLSKDLLSDINRLKTETDKDVIVRINIAYIEKARDKEYAIKKLLSHELTHVLLIIGNDGRNNSLYPKKHYIKASKDKTYKIPDLQSVQNDFPKSKTHKYKSFVDMYNSVCDYVYILNPYEQGSLKEETSYAIRNMSVEYMEENILHSNDLIYELVEATSEENGFYIFEELFAFLKDTINYGRYLDVLELFIIGYYTNKFLFTDIRSQYLKKDSINTMIDKPELMDDIYDDELDAIRHTLFKVIERKFKQYDEQLRDEVVTAFMIWKEQHK